jgi:hypothetical protein
MTTVTLITILVSPPSSTAIISSVIRSIYVVPRHPLHSRTHSSCNLDYNYYSEWLHQCDPDSATDKKNQEVPQPSVFFRPKSLTIGYSSKKKEKEKEENTDNFTKILKLANKKQKKTSKIAIPASNPSFLPSSRFSRGGTEANQLRGRNRRSRGKPMNPQTLILFSFFVCF